MRDLEGAKARIGGLPSIAIPLTRTAVAEWLVENHCLIGSAFRTAPTFLPLIGGSLVEGMMTIGSDLDFRMIVDGKVTGREVGELQPCFFAGSSVLWGDAVRLGIPLGH